MNYNQKYPGNCNGARDDGVVQTSAENVLAVSWRRGGYGTGGHGVATSAATVGCAGTEITPTNGALLLQMTSQEARRKPAIGVGRSRFVLRRRLWRRLSIFMTFQWWT